MVLDDETEGLAALHLLDTLAAVVACRDLAPARMARRYVRANAGGLGAGDRGATMLGTAERAPLVDAAFVGAMTAHSAEINDFMPSVFVQPGPAVVAAAVAVGELRRASRSELLRAIVVGYDLAFRVPLAVGGTNLRGAGIASHGVGPCFGAAAAAAALLPLPADGFAHVLGLAAQQASGSWQWLLDVEHMEKAFVFAGLGARNGVQAALLVEAGHRGVPDVADRPGTWFTSAAFADGDADLDALTDGLGSATALRACAFKRYPVGGPTQPAVQALLELRPDFDPSAVDRVVIEMPGRWEAFRDAAMPALNLPYLTAIILLDGRLDFVAAQSIERMRDDPEVAALRQRVEVRHDPDQEAGSGAARAESARVVIELRDGRRLERYVSHATGFPSHPMRAADIEAKAIELTGPHLGSGRARLLVEACTSGGAVDAATFAALVAR
jgi:2-methylcitrate dehydratase PrpD